MLRPRNGQQKKNTEPKYLLYTNTVDCLILAINGDTIKMESTRVHIAKKFQEGAPLINLSIPALTIPEGEVAAYVGT